MSMSKKLFVLLLSQNLEPMFWEDVVKSVLNTKKPIKTQNKAKQKKPKQSTAKQETDKVQRITEYNNDKEADSISIEMEDILLCEDGRQRPHVN